MLIATLHLLVKHCLPSAKHVALVGALALATLPSCAVYNASLLDTQAGVSESGGGDDAVGGTANGGGSNPAAAGKGATTNSGGAMGSAGSGSSPNGGASNGGSNNSGGNGGASNAGTGNANNGGAGASGGTTGSAGSGATGNAGGGSTGAGGSASAGAASGGSGGAAPINPCDRTNWKATASASSGSPKTTPALAIDGLTSTRWATGAVQVGGEWFLLDLGATAAHLTQVTLDATDHAGDEPLKYKVEVSSDGKTYFLVCSGTGAPSTVINFADTAARYVRITQTGSDPDANWWSIQELTLTCSPK